MNDYVTVFDVSTRSPDWTFVGVGLLPLVGGLVIAFARLRFNWRKPHWTFIAFLLAFGLVWLGVGRSVLMAHSEAVQALKSGNCSIAEGIVADFHPMPYEGHGEECFSVQDRRFCYSDYVVTPGFHNTASHGGPIRSGLPVRIAHWGPTILRLEIGKESVPTQADSAAAQHMAQEQWEEKSENDPLQQQMATAFLFTTVCWTLLANFQWKTNIGFWLKPPYRPITQYLFRIFFGMCLVGSTEQLIRRLILHPLTRRNAVATVTTAAIMCAVSGSMYGFSVWRKGRQPSL